MVMHRREDFGYIVVFPDGAIGMYDHSARALLEDGGSYSELNNHKLKKFVIAPDFHLASPLIVWMELTRECNLYCKHCYITAGPPREEELSTLEICKVLDDLKNMNVFSIAFTGGEPLLNEDFSYIVNYAHKLGFVVAVGTNGTLLTRDVIKRLPRQNCRVTVSLDGFKHHKALRGLDSEVVQEKLMLLKEYGVPSAISAVINHQNIAELPDLFNWAVENDFIVRFVDFNPVGRGRQNEKLLKLRIGDVEKSSHLFMSQLKYETEMDRLTGPCVSKFFNFALSLVYMTKRCKGGRSLAYICSNGDVYPCTTCAGTGKFIAGNVRDTAFSELWENSFKELRRASWSDFKACSTCELATKNYFCTNRCPPLAELLHGDEYSCGATPFEKRNLKRRTELVASEGYDFG